MGQQTEWKKWGELDPLWAVATWDGKRRNDPFPWTDEEFYDLGESDWIDFWNRWRSYGVTPRYCLEIGCGAGRLTMHIAQCFGRVLAADVSEHMLAYAAARIKSPSVSFALVDGCELPVANDSIDALFSAQVFQHFDSVEHGAAYFSEGARVLRPGGTLMVQLPVYSWPSSFARMFAAIHGLKKTLGTGHATILRWGITKGVVKTPPMRMLEYPVSFIYKELTKLGFVNIDVTTFQVRSNSSLHSFVMARKP